MFFFILWSDVICFIYSKRSAFWKKNLYNFIWSHGHIDTLISSCNMQHLFLWQGYRLEERGAFTHPYNLGSNCAILTQVQSLKTSSVKPGVYTKFAPILGSQAGGCTVYHFLSAYSHICYVQLASNFLWQNLPLFLGTWESTSQLEWWCNLRLPDT